jgi:hypothetical protein
MNTKDAEKMKQDFLLMAEKTGYFSGGIGGAVADWLITAISLYEAEKEIEELKK